MESRTRQSIDSRGHSTIYGQALINNAINCQALEISPEIYDDSTFSTNLIHSTSGLLL